MPLPSLRPRNTILYNVAFIVLTTVLAIAIAILVNEIQSRFASRLYQSLILLPYLMSWVIVSYLAYTFLSAETGMFNKSILEPLGLEAVNWYQEKKYWPFILIFVSVWKSVGYSMIIYLSSVVGISMDYFEAAKIDGASKWQQIKYITLPLLKPTLITLFILSVGQIFRSDFGLFLSDAEKQRSPLLRDENPGCLCISGSDEKQRLQHVQCGQRLSVGCRLHHDDRRQRPDP